MNETINEESQDWNNIFTDDCIFFRGMIHEYFFTDKKTNELRVSSAAFKSSKDISIFSSNKTNAQKTLDWGISIKKEWLGICSLTLKDVLKFNKENGSNLKIIETPIKETLFPNLAHCDLKNINSKKYPKKIALLSKIEIDNRK